jgi:hypothetical protein
MLALRQILWPINAGVAYALNSSPWPPGLFACTVTCYRLRASALPGCLVERNLKSGRGYFHLQLNLPPNGRNIFRVDVADDNTRIN